MKAVLIRLVILLLSVGFYLNIEGVKNLTYILVWTLGFLSMLESVYDFDSRPPILTTLETAKLLSYKACIVCLMLVTGYDGNYFTSSILLLESLYCRRPL
jgi:hypothetical protein